MAIDYTDILTHVGGEMVAGDLIARREGRNVVLGSKRGEMFDLTPAGHEVVAEMTEAAEAAKYHPLDHDHNGRKGGSLKRTKATPAPTVDIDEPAPADDRSLDDLLAE